MSYSTYQIPIERDQIKFHQHFVENSLCSTVPKEPEFHANFLMIKISMDVNWVQIASFYN